MPSGLKLGKRTAGGDALSGKRAQGNPKTQVPNTGTWGTRMEL